MRASRLILLFVALSGGALAAEIADTRAAELAKLRREVETMSSELQLRKEDMRAQIKAVEAQKLEIEVQIRREELRLAQIQGEAASRKAEISTHAGQSDTLRPAVLAAITQLRGSVAGGLPFRQADRLAELDTLQGQLERQEATPESAAARLWAFTEDELRLTRENGLDRQIIQIDGADVLADVARLGMVALYFRTDGGAVGMAVPGAGGWSWRTVTNRDDIKAIETLFEKLRHGVRSGDFTLPNPNGRSQ